MEEMKTMTMAAEELGVSYGQIMYWVNRGYVPHVVHYGRKMLGDEGMAVARSIADSYKWRRRPASQK